MVADEEIQPSGLLADGGKEFVRIGRWVGSSSNRHPRKLFMLSPSSCQLTAAAGERC